MDVYMHIEIYIYVNVYTHLCDTLIFADNEQRQFAKCGQTLQNTQTRKVKDFACFGEFVRTLALLVVPRQKHQSSLVRVRMCVCECARARLLPRACVRVCVWMQIQTNTLCNGRRAESSSICINNYMNIYTL